MNARAVMLLLLCSLSGCTLPSEDEAVRTIHDWLERTVRWENEHWGGMAGEIPLEWRDAPRFGVRVRVPVGAVVREEATATHFERQLGGVTGLWVRVLDRGAPTPAAALELAALCGDPAAVARLPDGRLEVTGGHDHLGSTSMFVASADHAVCCHGPIGASARLVELCRAWSPL
jgi:hypothetical protein